MISKLENFACEILELIEENKHLREVVKELDMEARMYKAYFYNNTEEAGKLSKNISHNASVKMCRSSGWLTSDDELKYD